MVMKMEVELLVFTPNPDYIAATAMRSCHTEEPAHKIIMDDELAAKMIKMAKKIKHYSVLEHVNFTFSIGKVSRALTHQLVRHRVASYSQQSQRYVKLTEPTYVVPPEIDGLATIQGPAWVEITPGELFGNMMKDAWRNYNELIKLGLKPEDARFVLPNACTTNIVITMNARELLHFFHLRCDVHAQWEIREMANRMLEMCRKVSPIIFEGNTDEWE